MACATRIGPLVDDAEMDYGTVSPDGSTLYIVPALDSTKIDAYTWPAGTGPTNLYTSSGPTIFSVTSDSSGRLFWVERDSGSGETTIRRWDGSVTTINDTLIDDFFTGYLTWYDGLLYIITDDDGALWSVDPDTGAETLLDSLSGGAGLTGEIVATPTGDLWMSGGGPARLAHYDVATDTLTVSTTAPEPRTFVIPQANGHARYWEHQGASTPFIYWDVAPDFTAVQVDCQIVEDFGVNGQGGGNGQAYNWDLSVNLVQVDDPETPFARALYQFDSAPLGGWTVGRVAWGTRGAWH